MKINIEFYQLLRDKINISSVARQKIKLTKKSGEYIGLCPFHGEKSPSFTINDSKKFFHCFGCGAHGDVVRFVSNVTGMSYKEAAIKLAQDNGIDLPKMSKEQEKIYEDSELVMNILELAKDFFKLSLTDNARNYLINRGINQKMIDEFEIGFAPSGNELQRFFQAKSTPLMHLEMSGLVGKREDNKIYEVFFDRIIFPIKNIYNRVIGFGARAIGDKMPKYLNSPETIVFKKNETLYAEEKAMVSIRKKNYSILVEGYVDVISLHNNGFKEAVASLGTAVTEFNLHKLWNNGDEIILCLDGDEAGIRASKKVINTILPIVTYEKKISFIKLPSNIDPDELVRKDPKLFQQLLDDRVTLSEILWSYEYEGKSFVTAEDKAGIEVNLENYCSLLSDSILKKNYRSFFKNQIWNNITKSKTNAKSIVVSKSNKCVPRYSEIEMIEKSICSLLIKFPELLEIEEAKQFYLNIDLIDENLSNFRDWFFATFPIESKIELKNIEDSVKNTGFHDVFLLLSDINQPFLDISLDKHNVDFRVLWSLLHKKYLLMSLKKEYMAILSENSGVAFEKAALYQKEIFKTTKELQDLYESFNSD